MWTTIWLITMAFGRAQGQEPTDQLVPAGWRGNPWGPEATRAREKGMIPPIVRTPSMTRWEEWGKKVLRDGDVVFRRGDARILYGHFPFSRFLANVSGSAFSHTGIVAIEGGEPVVYDTTKAGVRRQPFYVWVLDNAGPFGVKRLRPEYAAYVPKALSFCRQLFELQPPFDYDLNPDDTAYYCVEMCDKAFRKSGLPLAPPVRLGDMENIQEFPVIVFAFLQMSPLTLDQLVYFPGNERHGIWSSPYLTTVSAPPGGSSAKLPTNLSALARLFASESPRPTTPGPTGVSASR
ncbi:MAG: YiiX/YebB-like N1pC/P60 family cysteine hydrolase [Isosphaeraceae bacterium]